MQIGLSGGRRPNTCEQVDYRGGPPCVPWGSGFWAGLDLDPGESLVGFHPPFFKQQ